METQPKTQSKFKQRLQEMQEKENELKDIYTTNEIILSIKIASKVNQLKQQQKVLQQQINDIIVTILDMQEVEYSNKQIRLSDDSTKIILE